MNTSKAVNCEVTKSPAAANAGVGGTDIKVAAAIVVLTVTICERAAAVIFNPILDGGAIAPDGSRTVCIVVILIVALAKFAITGAITAPYVDKAAVAVVDIGIDTVMNPLAAIAGGNNIPGILFFL
tara:strand:- start:417 stop:794 length:378 start_codon:yes stop_codon:yes gene_type:complete